MNEIINKSKMTSVDIAKLSGKTHASILKSIRKMEEAWQKINGVKFDLVNYLDEKGEKRPMYSLTKTECLYIATKFNDESRAKLIIRWEELENDKQVFKLPQTYSEALRQLADTTEKKEIAVIQLKEANQTIEQNKSKVVFANAVSGSANSVLIRQFAKDLSCDDFEIGQNRVFQWLRDNKFINSINEPYQNYVAQGLFEVITRTVGHADNTFQSKTTKITGKGQIYFAKKIRESFLKEPA